MNNFAKEIFRYHLTQYVPQFKGTFLVVARLAGPRRMPLCGPARFCL